MLIGEDGKKIGNMTRDQAEKEAKSKGKDLILVDAVNKVYRIADAGKLKYEQRQRKKQQRAQKRTHKVKEIKLSPLTDAHDMEIKARRIREFLDKGLKTKVTMRFKGRQLAFKSAGLQKLLDLVMPMVEENLATIDREPKFEDRNLSVFLTPSKNKQVVTN